ncbi:putative transcriptional regulatory protein C417,09c [Talaromyces islandicus]|uniref:Putative transcriptional regulatory protein C417,09c n=1 Tax=Talaromyces islandicus TaxID=28573 RepID=A0A0U1M0U9_TALIS|nr:putative transcriptional regulatory protein C417,09c [Talaromyces islandicus]
MPPKVEKNSGGYKRSCIRCNQRKVGCDKEIPCGRCTKAGLECIQPEKKRAPRELKRPPIAEILAQLKGLKAEVQRLRAEAKPAELSDQVSGSDLQSSSEGEAPTARGRLLVHGGRTRYVGDEASVVLYDKIHELQEVCEGFTDEGDSHTYQAKSGLVPVPFIGILGSDHTTASPNLSTSTAPLPVSQLPALWAVYKSNVAPAIAILHLLSMETAIADAARVKSKLELEQGALIWAVVFAAVVSMTPQQSMSLLDEPLDICIENCRLAAEHAIARAKLISTQDIRVLQAATLFLLCLRQCGDSRLVWAESAIVVRVAQRQGLHHDGQPLGLSPYEIEMRRRLWWHICILDMLCSEDQGTATQIQLEMFDTRIPSNIDISVLRPELTTMPFPNLGFTDITLCIVHCEMMARLYWPSKTFDTNTAAISSVERERRLSELETHLETDYLQKLDLDSPIQWITAVIVRLTLSKAWLVTRLTGSAADATIINDEIFRMAVETVEFANLLHSDVRVAQWAWFTKSYRHRHVVAYILSELCSRPTSPDTDHAWEVVSRFYNTLQRENVDTNDMLQMPMARLMERAARSRRGMTAPPASVRTHDHSTDHCLPDSIALGDHDQDFSIGNIDLIPLSDSAPSLEHRLAVSHGNSSSVIDWLTEFWL